MFLRILQTSERNKSVNGNKGSSLEVEVNLTLTVLRKSKVKKGSKVSRKVLPLGVDIRS